MRKLLLVLIIMTSLFACTNKEVSVEKGFTKINFEKGVPISSLSSKIVPDKKYPYWELVEIDKMTLGIQKSKEDLKIKRFGDSDKASHFKIEKQKKGFFNVTGWITGYSYIAYIDNDTVKYVTNESDLIRFIGEINNLEEAILVCNIKYKLWLAADDIRGGAYKKVDDGYELYMAKFEDCPIKRISFKIKVDKSGHTQIEKSKVYYESEDCIMVD